MISDVPSLDYEHQLDEVVAGLCVAMLQAYSGMVGQVGGERAGVQKWFLKAEVCGLELLQAVFHRLGNA